MMKVEHLFDSIGVGMCKRVAVHEFAVDTIHKRLVENPVSTNLVKQLQSINQLINYGQSIDGMVLN